MKISLTTVFVSLLSLAVNAQNVVNVDVPKVNEMIYNKGLLNITYSIIGTQTTNPPLNNYYPNSLNVDFVWTEHANTANTLSLQVSTGLNTNPYPGGTQNIQRKDTFRVPNCHFFSRYPPSTFDFSLVFTPIYNTITRTNGSIVEPTGTPQDKIIVPLAVTVDNSTFPKC
ncbi:uncharacterized protein ATC70_007602 [Mucor velutinosus]|uniref:Uncharacterized protein n=1 Tax=Mucor velutinosus TaxID=708070 RepID=A0AAN7D2B5_9FUNG|nr:hypothetical protein ATC70_007602 [Mucor velutinosus]